VYPSTGKARRAKNGQKERKPREYKGSQSARSLKQLTTHVHDKRSKWFKRATRTDPLSLVIPPLVAHHLNDATYPDDPSSEDAALDPFTCQLWAHHESSIKRGDPNTTYKSSSLVPDSYYVNVVKELHQHGHLERCGLDTTNSAMYRSIKNKLNRNLRYILFDCEPIGDRVGMPALYVVKREASPEPLPSIDQCKRVIPISQVRGY
jgi:hypothetical protein